MLRFVTQVDAKGVLGGTGRADHLIRHYLTKHLTKSISETCEAEHQRQKYHADRMAAELRYEPCSPTCPNWLRYGVQPKDARPGQVPGRCLGKAHKSKNLGYAGRRILVSRKWSNKTLTDHRADRRAWAMETLGLRQLRRSTATATPWRPVPPGDPDLPPLGARLLAEIANRQRWRILMGEQQQSEAARGRAA